MLRIVFEIEGFFLERSLRITHSLKAQEVAFSLVCPNLGAAATMSPLLVAANMAETTQRLHVPMGMQKTQLSGLVVCIRPQQDIT